MDKIKIGYLICEDHREPIYLSKHSWDCGWYWGFGYLGNKNLHFHMRDVIPNQSNANKLVFEDIGEVELLEKYNGWKLMELFAEAYILKDYAEMFYTGTAGIGEGFIKQNKEEAARVNKDLAKLLENIWDYLTNS